MKSINSEESNTHSLAFNTDPKLSPLMIERARISWAEQDILKKYVPTISPTLALVLHSTQPVGLELSSNLIAAIENVFTSTERESQKMDPERGIESLEELKHKTLKEISTVLQIPVE